MKYIAPTCLLQSPTPWRWTAITCASAWVLLTFCAPIAAGQEATPADELDVTMQIIADPDAKKPDEIVRRIPLPVRKAAEQSPSNETNSSEGPAKAQERNKKARELGDEMPKRANEQAHEAADQREQSRRSAADEHRRNPPKDPPPQSNRPPR